jgi:TusA-related sulfurtransferase
MQGCPTSMVTMSEELTELQKGILGVIISDAHRPNAITSILKKRSYNCNQNDVVQALIDLEKRNLAEKLSSKTWTAKGSAEEYVD